MTIFKEGADDTTSSKHSEGPHLAHVDVKFNHGNNLNSGLYKKKVKSKTSTKKKNNTSRVLRF